MINNRLNKPTEEEKKIFDDFKDKLSMQHSEFLKSLGYNEKSENSEVRVVGFETRNAVFLQYGHWTFFMGKHTENLHLNYCGRAIGFTKKSSKSKLKTVHEKNSENVKKLQDIIDDEIFVDPQEGDYLVINSTFGSDERRTEFSFSRGSLTRVNIDCNATYSPPGIADPATHEICEHAKEIICDIKNGKLPISKQYDLEQEAIDYVDKHGMPENEDLRQLHQAISGRTPDGEIILDSFYTRVNTIISNSIIGDISESDKKYISAIVLNGINNDLESGYLGYFVKHKVPELEEPLTEYVNKISVRLNRE